MMQIINFDFIAVSRFDKSHNYTFCCHVLCITNKTVTMFAQMNDIVKLAE